MLLSRAGRSFGIQNLIGSGRRLRRQSIKFSGKCRYNFVSNQANAQIEWYMQPLFARSRLNRVLQKPFELLICIFGALIGRGVRVRTKAIGSLIVFLNRFLIILRTHFGCPKRFQEPMTILQLFLKRAGVGSDRNL